MSDVGKTKERGPVEELIAKRLRPINKKIQRFRGYAAKPESDLNADQRAAIAQLPVLEATVRELEDLSKAVEETELVAAAKARELREAADREFEERVQARLAEHHATIADSIGGFLGLHALLRPARSDDHVNLTFAPLALPPRLEDEVLATDILRVARLYDDLVAGGDPARAVLSMLAVGTTGDDEDDRVHRLMGIFSAGGDEDTPQSENEINGATVAVEVELEIDEEEEAEAEEETEPLRPPTVGSVGLNAFDPPINLTRGMPLNFLQEDELEQPTQPTTESFEIIAATASYEYEVIEPQGVELSSAPISIAPTPQPQPTMTSMNWADEEGEEDESAERLRSALASGVATPEVASGKSTPQGGRKRKPRGEKKEKEKTQGQGQQNGSGKENKDTKEKEQKEPKERKPRPPKEKKEGPGGKGKPDDGFQEVARKSTPSRGRGRGRGGRGGGTPRDGRPADKPKDKPEAKEKKSIYKEVQPAAGALHL